MAILKRKITIEEIQGKKYTVIWESPSKALTMEEMQEYFMALPDGSLIIYVENDYYATALPALPRFPKPEHAKLLYRYMAAGLYPACTYGNYTVGVCRDASKTCDRGYGFNTTHAVDADGWRIEVAFGD